MLYEVRLVRAASADQVVLDIRLLEDWEQYRSRRTEIVFEGCFHVRADMSWGVECMSDGEMIYSGSASTDGEGIQAVQAEWKRDFADAPLGQFTLDLASTGSIIEVVFQSVTVRYQTPSDNHAAPNAYPMKRAE